MMVIDEGGIDQDQRFAGGNEIEMPGRGGRRTTRRAIVAIALGRRQGQRGFDGRRGAASCAGVSVAVMPLACVSM